MCNRYKIKGKYEVHIPSDGGRKSETIITDNPREAVWEANKSANRTIENVCGEKEFYFDDNKWHSRPIEL